MNRCLVFLVLAISFGCDGESSLDAGPADAGTDGGSDAAVDAATPTAPTATTALGPVVGLLGAGVSAFLGIPYAAPPVGDLRFAPPAPPAPWTEPLEATRTPPRCVQQALGIDLASQEDCLYLNVHAPAPAPVDAPVMVWIHGGAFVFGEGAQTDGGTLGDLLAAEHGVVVVSMNYRLGPFGFLAHPALTDEQGTSGNFGLSDQRAALEWVRDNIAAFGGDPDNVTIFGESAGGFSVCAHLMSPASRGLFSRAISQSGLCDSAMSTLAEAEADGEGFSTTLGCEGEADVLACLRGKTADEVKDADAFGTTLFTEIGGRRLWWPIADGTILPGDFRARVEAGEVADVPSIFGWNRDEGTLFILLAEQAGEVADEDAYMTIAADIAAAQGAAVDDVLAQYPLADYPDPGAALAAIIGHATLACPSRRAARLLAAGGADVHVYRFEYPDAAFQLVSERELGAFHSADIQYVFGHPAALGRRAFLGDDLALHRAMSGYWGRFAHGDPNGDGAPEWPSYDVDGDAYLILDRTVSASTAPDQGDCALWDAARATSGG